QLVRGNVAERADKPVHGLRRLLLAHRDHVIHRSFSILASALNHGSERTIVLVPVSIGVQQLLCCSETDANLRRLTLAKPAKWKPRRCEARTTLTGFGCSLRLERVVCCSVLRGFNVILNIVEAIRLSRRHPFVFGEAMSSTEKNV